MCCIVPRMFKDVICHIAFFDYCAVELADARRETCNAVAMRYLSRMSIITLAFRDRSGADIPELVAQQRTLHDGILLLGPKVRPWAAGIRMSMRSRVGAPHGAVGAQRGPLRCAVSTRRPGEGTHHVHALFLWQGCPHVQ